MLLHILFFLGSITLFAKESFVSSIISSENEPSILIQGTVNAITGAWVAHEQDLVIQGKEPIVISRSFLTGSSEWSIVPFIQGEETEVSHIMITEKSGAKIRYQQTGRTKKIDGEIFVYYTPCDLDLGYTNTSRGEISSRTNLNNQVLFVDSKHKIFILSCSDGTEKIYRKIHKGNGAYRPISERLPNGNWVLYDYEEIPLDKEGKNKQINLKSIRTVDPTQTIVFAKADFIYEDKKRKNPHFFVLGSDGSQVEYCYDRYGSKIREVISSSHSTKNYAYDGNQLSKIQLPLERSVQAEYYRYGKHIVRDLEVEIAPIIIDPDRLEPEWIPDPREGRVKTLLSPVGSEGKIKTTHSIIYDLANRKTTAYEIDGQRTEYIWDESQRIHKILYFDREGKVLSTRQFLWSHKGLLLWSSTLDSQGNPQLARSYTYDDKGNIIVLRVFGNLSGTGAPLRLDAKGRVVEDGVESSSRFFKYYEGTFSLLKSEEDERGKKVEYTYLEGTDLRASQLTYDGPILRERKYWRYDQNSCLIQESVDDGICCFEDDLRGVTERRILSFTLNQDGPYLGMPKILEEKFFENGIEKLLQKCVLSYTNYGRISQKSMYDADGVLCYRLDYRYDEKGRLIEETDPLGRVQKFTYDECGNQISHSHFSRRVLSDFTYNKANLRVRSHQIGDDGIEIEQTYEYDDKNRLIFEKKPLGQYVRYTYDFQGCLQSQKLPPLQHGQSEVCFSYVYDCFGRVIQQIDPEARVTKTVYNAYNQPIWIEYPDHNTESSVYDVDGKRKAVTDVEGVRTDFVYDAFGRVLSQTVSFQGLILKTQSSEYSSFHEVAKIDAEGDRTEYQYDGAGRLILETLDHESTNYRYDSLGRCFYERKGDCVAIKEFNLLNQILEQRTENQQGNVLLSTRYAYDMAGNTISIRRSIQGQEAIETFSYDSLGRQVKQVDALGFSTLFSYQMTPCLEETVIDPSGLVTVKQYNPQKKVAHLEVKKGQKLLLATDYEYDYMGGVVEERSHNYWQAPRLILTRKEYSWNGLLTGLIEAFGTREERRTYHQYDALGRLVKTIKPDGLVLNFAYSPLGFRTSITSSDGSIEYNFTYDRMGRLLTSRDCVLHTVTNRRYDGHGRVVKENQGTGFSIESAYDEVGRRKGVRFFDGSSIEYRYHDGYLSSVTKFSERGEKLYQHGYGAYDLSGNLLQESLIGDLGVVDYRFNLKGERDGCHSAYQTHQIFERDCLGNVVRAHLNDLETCYTYDDLSQVSTETGVVDHKYVHDAHFALLQKDDEVYEHDALLQMPSHFLYDERGNPTQQGDFQFQYDALDRLVVFASKDVCAKYTYDADHRRLSKTVFALQNGTWEKVRHLRFLYDGQNEIGSVDEDGKIVELRILGRSSDAEMGSAVAIEIFGEVYAPLYDLQRNITALISLKKGTIESLSYFGVFGEENRVKISSNPWRFASKRVDEESGFVYFGRRYYVPQMGRWLTCDPAGAVDGVNLYAYVKNNPLRYFDLYGLYADDNASSVHFQDYAREGGSNWHFDGASSLVCLAESGGGTVHYHCGINNSFHDVMTSVQTIFENLGSQYTIWGHWIHEEGMLKGLSHVGLEKFTEARSSAFEFLQGLFVSSLKFAATKYLEQFSDIGKMIQQETKLLRNISNQIIEQGNPHQKQVHLAFSNGGYVLNEALKRLTPEERDTAIVITSGSTKWIKPNMAHRVFNLCGDKDFASIMANGGQSSLQEAADRKMVQIVPQEETQAWVKGHYNLQPDYQAKIQKVIIRDIAGNYEIY